MNNVVILDLDGVLILTPNWKADKIHSDGYSDFDINCIKNLNTLMANTNAELWLSSSRRFGKRLNEFNTIFKNRNIKTKIKGFLPGDTFGIKRKTEIDSFLDHEPIKNFLIIDDDKSLNDLEDNRKSFLIQTESLIGFNKEKLALALQITKKWISS